MSKADEKRGKAANTALQRIETANALLHAEMQITLHGVKKSVREMQVEVNGIGAAKQVSEAHKKMDLVLLSISELHQTVLRNRPLRLKIWDWIKRKLGRS